MHMLRILLHMEHAHMRMPRRPPYTCSWYSSDRLHTDQIALAVPMKKHWLFFFLPITLFFDSLIIVHLYLAFKKKIIQLHDRANCDHCIATFHCNLPESMLLGWCKLLWQTVSLRKLKMVEYSPICHLRIAQLSTFFFVDKNFLPITGIILYPQISIWTVAHRNPSTAMVQPTDLVGWRARPRSDYKGPDFARNGPSVASLASIGVARLCSCATLSKY